MPHNGIHKGIISETDWELAHQKTAKDRRGKKCRESKESPA